jgi:tRNA pseudouridine38-40 synthase
LAETKRIALIMEYDGTRYHGFQLQANLDTIQGETEKALWKLTGERVRVTAASRTDAGVHAEGQVACFRTKSSLPPAKFVSGLNHYLPGDIAVKAAYQVEDSFNARREAVSREYNYRILNSDTRSPTRQSSTYLVPRRLDIGAINQACQVLVGRHDFASFMTGDGTSVTSTVRTVYRAEAAIEGELVVFDMVANSFLPHQVRNTIGTLVRVGLGAMSVTDFNDVAAAKTPGLAGPTAPAQGLCLKQINYRRPFGEN